MNWTCSSTGRDKKFMNNFGEETCSEATSWKDNELMCNMDVIKANCED
jgi:hypothetical protein